MVHGSLSMAHCLLSEYWNNIKVFEIIKAIRFILDPATKLIQLAKRDHLCKKTDNVGILVEPRYRIYWEELKKPYVPQPESVSYVDDEGEHEIMEFDMTEKFFTRFHDEIWMEKFAFEFQKPLGIRSV